MSNRSRYLVLKSWNGKKVIIDTVQVRFERLKKRIFSWAQVCAPLFATAGVRVTMLTLTYDYKGTIVKSSVWKAGHISEFMKRLVWRLGKKLLAYAWVAELQKNGHVHYHVLVLHRGYVPFPDKPYVIRGKNYPPMWRNGMSRVDVKVRSIFYICKYVGKEKQKEFEKFPSNAHAWGVYISDNVLRSNLRYVCLTKGQQLIVDHFGYEALGDEINKKNYWRDDDDKLWFAGAAMSREFAEVI